MDARRKKDNARTAAWVKKNPERKRATDSAYYVTNRERVIARSREWDQIHPHEARARGLRYKRRHPEQSLWSGAKHRALKEGIAFDIDPSDVVIPLLCPVLGLLLDLSGGQRRNTSPSLDKVIPSLGYVKGNVRVISWRANRLKNDGTLDELIAIGRDAAALTYLARVV